MIDKKVMSMRNKGAGINKIVSELGITSTEVKKIIEANQWDKSVPYEAPEYAPICNATSTGLYRGEGLDYRK